MAENGISGNRRADRRYDIELNLHWKLIRRRKIIQNGAGRTIDLSSGGVRFNAGRQLVPGMDVELSIAWPVLLQNVAAMQLLVTGRIQWTAGDEVGVRVAKHEFRTAGMAADHKPASSGTGRPQTMTTVAGFDRFNRIQ